ncbi:phage regulatory protein/antirepressor Ant [Lampropedia aestuarii]|uniref:Phage regulatory protein/antirepressor Ant n=2 Tax=Lampropedia aestuarii TaxID=2562762 RepID=A0A4S5BY43_9BURK|nr:phage regulatory protein/antirepressor Ant [Lampropedia aestuarii]
MSSREIAELVEARHNDVVATIERLFEKGLLRSSRKTRREDTGGRPIEVYDLIERDTHLVVSGYSDEHRARVIDRWQELEAQQAPSLPKTMAQALRLAADQAEQIEQQAEQLALAAPKVEYVDRYVAANGAKGFRQVAKLLNANEHEFRAWLQDEKIMYRLGGEWAAYQNHIDAGRFVVKAGVASQNDHAFNATRFTPKGVNWVAGEWGKYQAAKAQASGVQS